MDIVSLIISIGTIVSGLVVGLLYFFGAFGKAERDNNKDAQEASSFVISSFKGKIEILEAKVAEQATELKKMATKLESIVTENQLLRTILEGRDEDTKRFYTEGFKAMDKSQLILEKVTRTDVNVDKLYGAIEKHLAKIETTMQPTTTVITTTTQ